MSSGIMIEVFVLYSCKGKVTNINVWPYPQRQNCWRPLQCTTYIPSVHCCIKCKVVAGTISNPCQRSCTQGPETKWCLFYLQGALAIFLQCRTDDKIPGNKDFLCIKTTARTKCLTCVHSASVNVDRLKETKMTRSMSITSLPSTLALNTSWLDVDVIRACCLTQCFPYVTTDLTWTMHTCIFEIHHTLHVQIKKKKVPQCQSLCCSQQTLTWHLNTKMFRLVS